MPNQMPAIFLIILSGVLYGFSKRNPNSPLVKLARKYGWIVILACFADIISIQIQAPFGAIGIIEDLLMLLVGYLIFRNLRKQKNK